MKERRSLTNKELQSIRIEEDMLQGNFNRMCVTDDVKELWSMYKTALDRVSRIFNTNLTRFFEDEKEGDSNE